MFRFLITVCTLLFTSLPTQAIVSMEDLHLGTVHTGFSGQLDLGARGRSGNSNTTNLSLGSRLQWQHGKQTNYLLVKTAYGDSNGVRNTERWFIHARHIQKLNTDLDWEVFVQGSGDKFARLNFRGLLGGGLRLHLADDPGKSQVILGLGGYYEREILIGDGYPDVGTTSTFRGNTYLVLKTAISNNTTLVSTTYYQPGLAQWSDFRLLEQAVLKVAINHRLSLGLSLDINHDSRPPLGVRQTDIIYKTTLGLDF